MAVQLLMSEGAYFNNFEVLLMVPCAGVTKRKILHTYAMDVYLKR